MSRNKRKKQKEDTWESPLCAIEDSAKNHAETTGDHKELQKINDYRDVWRPPFHSDGAGYVYDSDWNMVFTTDFHDDDIHVANNIAALLNDDPSATKMHNLEVKQGCDLYQDGKLLGFFRGWGHLTGCGALNLPVKRATEIQDEFIKWCLTKLQ